MVMSKIWGMGRAEHAPSPKFWELPRRFQMSYSRDLPKIGVGMGSLRPCQPLFSGL